MGVVVVRRVADLGPELALAPERFDPRRRPTCEQGSRLEDVVELVTASLSPSSLPAQSRALVLDTTHAREGFVLAWHAPVGPTAIGSAKRPLAPGDVIVSRLRTYLRQIAYVDAALFAEEAGGHLVLASTEFFVLRGRGGFDAACLVPFLLGAPQQAALAAAQEGGHHPRVSREALLSLSLPAGLLARSAQLAAEVRAVAARVRVGLTAAQALIADCEGLDEGRRRHRGREGC